MEVQLDRRYPLSVPLDAAWGVLADVRAVAGCMPGAQITEEIDPDHYKGTVRTKVGPALMNLAGDIEVLARDAGTRSLSLMGKGADRGGSSVAMKLAAHLEAGEAAGACVLAGAATVTVSGKLAQFGGRLLVPVADALLAQFAATFEEQARALAVSAAQGVDAGAAAAAELVAPAAGGGAALAPAAASAPAMPPRELNALHLVWVVLRGWLRHLFGRKAA